VLKYHESAINLAAFLNKFGVDFIEKDLFIFKFI